jgi:hypothetical protein
MLLLLVIMDPKYLNLFTYSVLLFTLIYFSSTVLRALSMYFVLL